MKRRQVVMQYRPSCSYQALSQRGPKIVLATFGSHGDLHPFLAVALCLKQRGAAPVIAASQLYRDKVVAAGIDFHHMRPDPADSMRRLQMDYAELVRAAGQRPDFVVKHLVLPHLRESYDDVLAILADADMVVTHSAAYGAKLAAEKCSLPHLGIALQPLVLLSAFDPPIMATMPGLSRWIYRRGVRYAQAYLKVARAVSRRWAAPIDELRREVGLPRASGHPLFEGQFTAEGAIGLFSPVLGSVQPDHPPRISIEGFAFYDSESGGPPMLSQTLKAFLADGAAPLIFTLGTSAVHDAGHFMEQSLAAVRSLGMRAIFVLDIQQQQRWSAHASSTVMISGYVPYSLLFAYGSIIVHHGGVGTTAQALRAGRPQLIVPHLVDQPDNADRIRRLGVGRTISLRKFRAPCIIRELQLMHSDSTYKARAGSVGRQVSLEDGAGAAAQRILATLAARI